MKTVLIFGTFDIIHHGHIHLFKQAKDYGDYLIVCVARDKNVQKIKGEQPLHNESERKEMLQNMKIIDEVILGHNFDPYICICETKPNIIALGYDQKIFVDQLSDAITSFGLEIPIVRLKPYDPDKYKTRIMRKYIERVA